MLREDGHIVSFDATLRGIWHFRILRNEDKGDEQQDGLGPTAKVAGQTLVTKSSGSMEPASWHKLLNPNSHGPGLANKSQVSAGAQPNHSQPTESADQDPKLPVGEPADLPKTELAPDLIYEWFISALLLTVSSAFCLRMKAVPLNYRTVLLPLRQGVSDDAATWGEGHEHVLGTFRSYLTSTGALLLSFSVASCKGFASLEHLLSAPLTPTSNVLAAPFGVMSNDEHFPSSNHLAASLAQTPNTQALSMRTANSAATSLWKQACLKILELRGISMDRLQECSWLNLLVSNPKSHEAKAESGSAVAASTVTIPWPAPLCFRKKAVEIPATNCTGDNLLIGYEESHDPLGAAKGWLSSAGERDEKKTKRRAERAAATSRDALGSDPRTSKLNAPSPMNLRRPSTAANGAVYPTPPDALHHLNGVTPSVDGAMSSPGNPLSAAADADIECAAPSANLINQQEDARSETSDQKRPNDNNLLSEAGNMFDDMGADMFGDGDNDITDADFNFFDEQPQDIDLDMSLGSLKDPETPAGNDVKKEESEDAALAADAPQAGTERQEVVFAKPELKHARSSQIDETPTRSREGQNTSAKRGSSPFDPHSVFKRLRAAASMQQKKATLDKEASTRSAKIFSKVDFDPNMPMLNKKYEHGGFFDYGEVGKPATKLEPGTLPQTDYLKRHGKSRLKGRSRSRRSSLEKTLNNIDGHRLDQRLLKLDVEVSDDDDTSMDSGQGDSASSVDEPISPVKSTVKQSLQADDDSVSQVTSLKEHDAAEEPDDRFALDLPRLSRLDTPEVSLFQYFSEPEPLALNISLSDEDMIQVAQLVAEQAATGSLSICQNHQTTSLTASPQDVKNEQLANARNAMKKLQGAATQVLGDIVPVRLKSFLDVQDSPLFSQSANRLQPRQVPGRDSNAEPIKPSNLYQIPSPHLEVRRSDAKLSVLPTAVTFWESLGLAPSSGSKDVCAICVCPRWTGMTDNVKTFLGRIKSVYETLKLGTFESMPLSADQVDGTLLYEVDRISTSPGATMTGHGSALVESMETLRAAISNLPGTDTNIVVYFVYSPNNPGTIVEACTAFQKFFESYQQALATKREAPKNEVVLQLISADTISSPTSMVITPCSDLVKLCTEMYDRCTLFGGPMPAPAIRLEQPLPRIIDFKLSNVPSSSLIRENSCIHVAYARSTDGRWVTAAWTDDRGNEQATAAYCLGRKGQTESRTMNEVTNEIWETTIDLISAWKVHYRIIVTKCGPNEEGEVEFWSELAKTEIHASVTMVLMTVDTNPSLQLIPSAVKLPIQNTSFYTTPVSTPQANIVSPEASTTPATPARDAAANVATPGGESTGDADTDAVLADVMEQTWGAVVGHRLSNSVSTLEVKPALISGYLIKRTGAKAEDALSVMEVNIVHTEANPRAYEPLLREMLSYFRGLGTLARARGVVDRETDVRPWHVAAAEKALRALYLLM